MARDTRTPDLFAFLHGNHEARERLSMEERSRPALQAAKTRKARAMQDMRQAAKDGAQQAYDHANEVHPDWGARASALVVAYAERNSAFLTEDVRAWAHGEQGLPMPPDPRSWGTVMTTTARKKIIEANGTRRTRIPPAHSKRMTLWQSRVFRGVS